MSSDKHIRFLQLAKAVSQLSPTVSRKRVGAVVVQKRIVLGTGLNCTSANKKLSVIKKDGHCCLHAEIDACLKVKNIKRLVGATIYVFRSSNINESLFARPCKNCQNILQKFGVSTMVYTTNNQNSISYNIESI